MMMKDKVVNGPQNAAHRSLYHALGLTAEEQQRPLIAVVSSYNEIVPGHMNLDTLQIKLLKENIILLKNLEKI